MANCSNCKEKYNLQIGRVAVEFTCPYGVSTVPKNEYEQNFDDKECRFYKTNTITIK